MSQRYFFKDPVIKQESQSADVHEDFFEVKLECWEDGFDETEPSPFASYDYELLEQVKREAEEAGEMDISPLEEPLVTRQEEFHAIRFFSVLNPDMFASDAPEIINLDDDDEEEWQTLTFDEYGNCTVSSPVKHKK